MKRKNILSIFIYLLAIIVVLTCSSCNKNYKSQLKHDGTGTIEVLLTSNKDESEFKKVLDKRLEYYNQGEDYLTLKSFEKIENGYKIFVKFRRIDKFSTNGNYQYARFNQIASTHISGLTGEELLNTWDKGMLQYGKTCTAYDENGLMTVKIAKGNNPAIQAFDISSNIISAEDFISKSKVASKNETMVMMNLLNVEKLISAKIELPGKIKYYSSQGIKLINENTIEITPVKVYTNITHSDSSIPPINNELKNAVLGFVVYEKTMNPVLVGFIIIGSTILLSLIILFVVKCISLGKKEKGTAENKKSSFVLGMKKIWSSKSMRMARKHKLLYLFLLPAVAIVLIFNYAPMFGLVIAFQDYRIEEGVFQSEFVGLARFKTIFMSPDTKAFLYYRNTIYIALIRIATNFPIILIFTLLLHSMRNRKAKASVQIISYIPYFISWIAVGGMATNLFTEYGGLLNKVITFLGGNKIEWYKSPQYWWGILAISSLWKGMGWSTLIYVASLGSINEELYDACEVDGGGRFRQAMSVTIPGIMPVILLQVILDIGSILSDNYDQILAMTNATEILDATTSVVGTIEFKAISDGINTGFSRAAVLSLIRGVIGTILVLITNRAIKLSDNEGII